MLIHELDQRIQGMLEDDRVGIEQEDVFGRVGRLEGRSDHGVVAPGESPVGEDGREIHPGIPAVLGDRAPEAPFGVAPGAILADRDPGALDLVDHAAERAQAVDREVGHAVRHDHDE